MNQVENVSGFQPSEGNFLCETNVYGTCRHILSFLTNICGNIHLLSKEKENLCVMHGYNITKSGNMIFIFVLSWSPYCISSELCCACIMIDFIFRVVPKCFKSSKIEWRVNLYCCISKGNWNRITFLVKRLPSPISPPWT